MFTVFWFNKQNELEIQIKNLNFGTKDLEFTCSVDFFKGESPTKILE